MSGRRDRGNPEEDVTLPITPMLDMAFQLLMYFILTYHPSAMEGQMDMSMPQKATSGTPGGAPDPMAEANPDKDLDVPLDLNVRVQSQNGSNYTITLEEAGVNTDMGSDLNLLGNQLQRIFKDKAAGVNDALKGLEGKEWDEALKKELKKMTLKVQGDSRVELGNLMEVMDVCRMAGTRAFKEAGIDVGKLSVVGLSFASPPDLNLGVGQ
jgi:biopolymer transport protein ExbD